ELILLAPCLHLMPYVLKDPEVRFRKRHLDFLVNQENLRNLKLGSKINKYIRDFLDDKDFIEVETPMMNMIAGGAAAKPFQTYHNDMKMDLYMRIAPELYLKQLIVGGLERVYELGRQFRNETCDVTHNAEFTSLEFYMTHSDYQDLMNMVEELLSGLVFNLFKKYSLKYGKENEEDNKAITINFEPPYKRVNIIPTLEKIMKKEIPTPYSSDETREFLDKYCEDNNIECSNPKTTARLFDKLIGHYLEVNCQNPTFLVGHPAIMSPLAKENPDNPEITDRFELFAAGFEISNAFSELNDPVEQLRRFQLQTKDKNEGDDEIPDVDTDYCQALEYALPPTAGCGIGIDRLKMLLTNNQTIREILAFPMMKPL
ncbi:unnamed protein product, partial [marine sediment metagenome]